MNIFLLQRCLANSARPTSSMVVLTLSCILLLLPMLSTSTWCSEAAAAAARHNKRRQADKYPQEYYPLPHAAGLSGAGTHVVLLDTGLDEGVRLASTNTMHCWSAVPHVACGDAGYEHGTRSATVLAGNVCVDVDNTSFIHIQDGASRDSSPTRCYKGMAPDASVEVIRVFDSNRKTKLSYIVAALQNISARASQIDVVSLSYGTEDFTDVTVHQLIKKLTAAGVVVVVAAGNEGGAALGSILSPADLPEVLTVGSADVSFSEAGHRVVTVSTFSSRGPTTRELPIGAGRVKPDVVAVGRHVLALQRVRVTGQVASALKTVPAQGTSIAAPLVAGVVAILIESMRGDTNTGTRMHIGLAKMALMGSAQRITLRHDHRLLRPASDTNEHDDDGIFAGDALLRTYTDYASVLHTSMLSQGAGEVDLASSLTQLKTYFSGSAQARPSLLVFPNSIYTIPEDDGGGDSRYHCEYHWPWCEQPLYPGTTPRIYNLTIHSLQAAGAATFDVSHFSVQVQKVVAYTSSHSKAVLIEEHNDAFPYEALVCSAQASLLRMEAFTGTVSIIVRVHASMHHWEGWDTYERLHIYGTFSNLCTMEGKHTCTNVSFTFALIPPPPRERRVLLDVSHQWMNPVELHNITGSKFIAGDDPHEGQAAAYHFPPYPFISSTSSHFRREYAELHGDHPFTNLAVLYLYLTRELHLLVELFPVLSLPPQDMRSYLSSIGTVCLVDPELPLLSDVRRSLARAVREDALHVVVMADWFSPSVAQHLKWDSGDAHNNESAAVNTTTIEEGCAIVPGTCHNPSINAFLREVTACCCGCPSIQLSEEVVIDGTVTVPSGSGWRTIATLNGATSVAVVNTDDDNNNYSNCSYNAIACSPRSGGQSMLIKKSSDSETGNTVVEDTWSLTAAPHGVLGFLQSRTPDKKGNVAVFTDSNCLSTSDPRARHMLMNVMEAAGLMQHYGDSPLSQSVHMFMEELYRTEGGQQPTMCMELLKELLYAVTSDDLLWLHKSWACSSSGSDTLQRRSGGHDASVQEDTFIYAYRRLEASGPSRVASANEVMSLFSATQERQNGNASVYFKTGFLASNQSRHLVALRTRYHGVPPSTALQQSSRAPSQFGWGVSMYAVAAASILVLLLGYYYDCVPRAGAGHEKEE